MGIEIRVPTDDDVEAMARADARAFGTVMKPDEIELVRSIMELDRFRIAVDGGVVVGIVGSWRFDTAVHGGAALSTAGVTWVSVGATHRRQGLLTRMIQELHDDVDARGEALATLTASEGAIYERFGYGVATPVRVTDIATARASFRPEHVPAPGQVRPVDGPLTRDEVVAAVDERWDRYWRTQPGEVSRTTAWNRKRLAEHEPDGVLVLHDDGYAFWKIEPDWRDGHPSHTLVLLELVPVTPDAHAALWHTVLSVDLVGGVRSYRVPPDDPLPYLLRDGRALRTVELNDGVWVNVRDVPAAFGARSYGVDDDLVVESAGRRWRIGASGATKVRTRPDLECDHATLGTLLLGGTRPSTLAAGHRLRARSDDVLRRADALFTLAPSPFCRTPF